LKNNDVAFLDFAYDERIKPEFFRDSIHLNAEGKQAFTHLLAEELEPILNQH
jgi:lysophospholipase L1-like esterase